MWNVEVSRSGVTVRGLMKRRSVVLDTSWFGGVGGGGRWKVGRWMVLARGFWEGGLLLMLLFIDVDVILLLMLY